MDIGLGSEQLAINLKWSSLQLPFFKLVVDFVKLAS